MGLRKGQRWYDGVLVHIIGDGLVNKGSKMRTTRCGEPAQQMAARLPRCAKVSCIACLADSPDFTAVLVVTSLD